MFQAVYKDMCIKALEDENKALKDRNSELSDGWYTSRVDYWNMKEELEMWKEDYKILFLKNKELKESLTAVVVRMFCE
jgi:hypothetical protein